MKDVSARKSSEQLQKVTYMVVEEGEAKLQRETLLVSRSESGKWSLQEAAFWAHQLIKVPFVNSKQNKVVIMKTLDDGVDKYFSCVKVWKATFGGAVQQKSQKP